MPARVAEIVPREPNINYSHLFPTTSIVVTPLQTTESDKHSLSTGQSAPSTGPSSPSIKSANSRHHYLRNKSATVISTPTNASIPCPSDTSSAKRPASSPPTTLYSPSVSTYFKQQPGGLGIDSRSPNRRQPASRSSHGIETSSGPPPALITQRSYTTDSAWKQPTPPDGSHFSKYPPDTQKSIDLIINSVQSTADEKDSAVNSKATSSVRRRPEMAGEKKGMMAVFERTQSGHDEDQDSTLRCFDPGASTYSNFAANEKRSGHATNNDADEQTKSSHEDLFLILARSNSLADNDKDATFKDERRRVSLDS